MANIEYSIHMLNDQTGWTAWNWEFGVDEQGLQSMYLTYTIIYVLYLAAHAYAIKTHHDINYEVHTFLKLFTGIVCVEFFSVILNTSHWLAYKSDGVGKPVEADLARILDVVARICFLGLLMFLAEGWTISQVTLTNKSKWNIVGSMSAVIVIYMVLLIWEFAVATPEMIKPPQAQRVMLYLLSAVWIYFAGWFVYTCRQSYLSMSGSDEEQLAKRSFFFFLGISFGLWIISLPVIEFVGAVLDPWVYARVITVFNQTVTTLGFVIFTALIWPSHAAKYFTEIKRTAQPLYQSKQSDYGDL